MDSFSNRFQVLKGSLSTSALRNRCAGRDGVRSFSSSKVRSALRLMVVRTCGSSQYCSFQFLKGSISTSALYDRPRQSTASWFQFLKGSISTSAENRRFIINIHHVSVPQRFDQHFGSAFCKYHICLELWERFCTSLEIGLKLTGRSVGLSVKWL